jgi:ABC-type dipeptide/oligopeptide/nickel transport system permease subunit
VAGESTVVGRTPWQLFWVRFRRDKVALAALAFLVLLILVAILAGPITRAVAHPAGEQFPGALDPQLISRVIDVTLAFPILLLALGIGSACSLGTPRCWEQAEHAFVNGLSASLLVGACVLFGASVLVALLAPRRAQVTRTVEAAALSAHQPEAT